MRPLNSKGTMKIHRTACEHSLPGLATLSTQMKPSHRGAADVFEVLYFWALTERRRPNHLERERSWKQLVVHARWVAPSLGLLPCLLGIFCR